MAQLTNLIVSGAARFLNNLYGNLVGTVNGFDVQKSVPSNAVFTDTNTKVTSVGNHYTPTGTTTKSASGGTATNATGSSNAQQVVTGVTVDAAGHVTAVTSKGIYSTDADHITTATTSGSGNAVTAVSADANGALTVTKGTTFLTSHQDISGKADKSATVSTVAWDSTNKKLTKTINGTTSDVVTGATILGGLTKSQVTTALGYTPPTSDTNTWNAMTGATSSANGTVGYVNAVPPKDGYNTKYLRADGTWSVPPDHITTATTSGSGNAVTAVSASNGALTVTKGTTFLTSHQDISGKANLASPAFTGTPTAPTATAGTNNTQIATTAYVMNAFQANDAMVFKGTIGSSGATVTALPNTHYQGWTYKVITAGTYAGKVCEIGDMIICVTDGTSANNDHWTVVQTNIDGAVTGPASSTDAHVATFNGTTGKVIKDSGFTIGKSVPSNAVFTDTDTKVTSVGNHYTPTGSSTISASGGTATNATGSGSAQQVVTGVTVDAKGHVTAVTSKGIYSTDTNTHRPIQVNGTEVLGNNTTALNLKAGSNVTVTNSSGTVTIAATDTKYESKAAASGGTAVSLVTTGEKATWNAKTSNTGTVTKVTAGTGLTGGNITTTGTLAIDDSYFQELTSAEVEECFTSS